MVSGGGQIGPGGAVIWLRRLDGPTPRAAPAANQIITQRDKTFLPHVLAVPVGTSVQFRNDDRIYHNVFSIAKPNEFDAGIRATGATYSKTFNHPGVVELLCNIHSTMNAYVLVVDSPLLRQGAGLGRLHHPRRAAGTLRALRLARGRFHDHPQADHRRGGGGAGPGGLGRRRQAAQPLRPRQIRSQAATATGVLSTVSSEQVMGRPKTRVGR